MGDQSEDSGAQNARLMRHWLTTRILAMRSYVSMLPNSSDAVERLRGEAGEKRAARIITFVLKELGYEIVTPLEDSNNSVRRTVAGVFGSKK